MVDYSRWDRLGALLSDEEEEPQEMKARTRPRVTKFDKSTSVTFGDGAPLSVGVTDEPEKTVELAKEKCPPPDNEGRHQRVWWPHESEYEWTQDAKKVWIRFRLPSNTRGKHVLVIVKQRGDTDHKDCYVCVKVSGSTLHEMDFPYDVEIDEDGMADWSVQTTEDGNKVVELEVTKKVPIANAHVWWTCAGKGHSEISLDDIPERIERKGADGMRFAEAWSYAHAAFKERMKSHGVLPDSPKQTDEWKTNS
ncbi:hypothetical protein FVE85_6248 [Porphyridium purpureum]|uniref:CS domain-containing protein n=1 Tax=Porphyridium purpureum TaxID=35688 RepID=A0A5J4Z768_PORPP|nr:hypothetical protein FVE85_6248 [Porphyridium purpureum]|eukprot:POR2691..scf295_1